MSKIHNNYFCLNFQKLMFFHDVRWPPIGLIQIFKYKGKKFFCKKKISKKLKKISNKYLNSRLFIFFKKFKFFFSFIDKLN